MAEPAIQSINQHTQKTSLDWLFNILVQPSTGAGSGVAPATHEQFGMSLDLIRQALVEITNVVNNLTTTVPGKVLDARQGKVLADTIQAEIAKYGQPNGIATLGSDGKVPASQIPSLALVDVFTVTSEAAMLALDAQQGDMAIRTDSNQVFILSASPASTLENWIELAALKALVDASIADIAGTGRTTETVKGNADAIAKIQDNKVTAFQETPDDTHYPSEKLVNDSLEALKGTGYTEGTLKTHEDRLDTLEADESTEGSVAKTVKDAVEPIIEDVDDHEIRISVLEGWHPLTSWEDIQKAAKAGVARKYLKAGDLIETTYDGSPAIVEVVGINQDTPVAGAPAYKDVISFQFKDCLQDAQYSAPQALYNAVEGLDAGLYTFINSYDSLPYTFTIAQALPAGGVVVITSWGAGAYEPTVLKTMQADRLTDIETGVAVTQASGGTALAPVNLTPRCRYGASLYIESGIRHFLNDNSESYVWAAQGLYDMPSTYGAGGGFLKRLDADLASVIGPVVKKVARATADGGGQDTIEDKVWLLSRVEMGYGTEGVTTGEQVYERWNGATNAERIKLLSGSPRVWWLRPPGVSYQNISRLVDTDGTLYQLYSNVSRGLAPGLAVY
jgi:hypothetical protein